MPVVMKRKRSASNYNSYKRYRPSARAPLRSSARRRAAYRASNFRTGGFMGIEKKFYDTGLDSGALVAPTGAAGAEFDPATVATISAPAQGDGESNRDGRQIALKSAQINGLISVPVQANQTATDVAPVVSIFLVLDTQTNGAQLNSEDVFTNPAGVANTAWAPFRNLQYAKRFRVLSHKVVRIPMPQITYDGTNIEQGGVQVPFTMYVPLKNLVVNFTGTTAGVSNVTDNSLHVIAYASNISLAPTINYNARVRFVG